MRKLTKVADECGSRLHSWSPSTMTDFTGWVTLANAVRSLFYKNKGKFSFSALPGYVTYIGQFFRI